MATIEACTEPECLLRAEGVDDRFLAGLLLRMLAGEDVSDVMSFRPLIPKRDRCLRCVLGVMRGVGPLPTVEDVERSVQAARRSERRRRRIRRHEERTG